MPDAQIPVLEVEHLDVSYRTRAGEIPVLGDFNLSVMPGETVGLVGESGCGKSTVAMAIMHYLGRSGGIRGGSIRFKGRDLTGPPPEELRRVRGCEISMIYQEPFAALNPSLTLGQQLMEVPLTHEAVSTREAHARSLQVLRDVHLPDPGRIMGSYPHQISPGQQQRVVIAMGLLSRPALLLLDEPTSALDVTVQAGITRLIAGISERFGTAQIYISHNPGLIREICQRGVVMYCGEVVEEGDIGSLFSRPRHPYTRGLLECIPLPTTHGNPVPLLPIPGRLPLPHERPGGCNFGPRCGHFQQGRCDVGNIPMSPVTGSSSGHRVRCARWNELDHGTGRNRTGNARAMEPGEKVLEVDRVRKYYELRDRSLSALISGTRIHHVRANEELSFDARQGETVAIVGESGCGKSTFAKVLMGLETASAGRIVHDGHDIAALPVRERSAQQISRLQMVFQNPGDTLNPSHTIGAQIARVIRKFGAESDGERIRERVMELLDLVKLPREFYSRRPRQLSDGQKQRVAIARAFAGDPSVVVADELVSGLDVSVAAAVTELLLEIQRKQKTTVLFISHDLGLVRYLANRVVVMYLGHVMERGSTDEIFAPPYHPYTEALLAAVPVADPRFTRRAIPLQGNPPSIVNPPPGCPFVTRCPRRAGPRCESEFPPLRVTDTGHHIACHIPIQELAKVEPVIHGTSTAESSCSA